MSRARISLGFRDFSPRKSESYNRSNALEAKQGAARHSASNSARAMRVILVLRMSAPSGQ